MSWPHTFTTLSVDNRTAMQSRDPSIRLAALAAFSTNSSANDSSASVTADNKTAPSFVEEPGGRKLALHVVFLANIATMAASPRDGSQPSSLLSAPGVLVLDAFDGTAVDGETSSLFVLQCCCFCCYCCCYRCSCSCSFSFSCSCSCSR